MILNIIIGLSEPQLLFKCTHGMQKEKPGNLLAWKFTNWKVNFVQKFFILSYRAWKGKQPA